MGGIDSLAFGGGYRPIGKFARPHNGKMHRLLKRSTSSAAVGGGLLVESESPGAEIPKKIAWVIKSGPLSSISKRLC